ncbi:MAG: trigger factor family protein [Prevotellaceae bacterium]|jgi:trigger factor|nr:trigger factor family protein [Prevotellaceae bacterium]
MELIQNKEGLVATLTVKIPQEDYAAKVEKELRKARQTAQIRGFRPGNAPMSLIKKMYGQPVLIEEINKILLEALRNYEEENSEYLIGEVIPSEDKQPYTDFNTTKDFEFVYEAGFLPEFTFQINEIELPYYNILVSDEEIDREIKMICSKYFVYDYAETVEENCSVYAEVKYMKEDTEKMLYANFSVSQISDECKPLFLGAKANDLIDLEIRRAFDEDSLLKSLAITEKEAESLPEFLPFTIIEISKKTPVQMNQDLFDYIAGEDVIHSEEEFREYLKNKMKSDYETISLDKLYVDSVETVKEKANITLPEDFIARYIRCAHKNSETETETFESTVKDFTEEVKWEHIIDSTLQQYNFTPTPAILKNEAVKYLEKWMYYDAHMNSSEIEQLADRYLSDTTKLQEILRRVKRKQFARILKENAKLNTRDLNFEEFKGLFNTGNSETEEIIAEHNPETEETVNEIAVEESVTENSATENHENNKESQE